MLFHLWKHIFSIVADIVSFQQVPPAIDGGSMVADDKHNTMVSESDPNPLLTTKIVVGFPSQPME